MREDTRTLSSRVGVYPQDYLAFPTAMVKVMVLNAV